MRIFITRWGFDAYLEHLHAGLFDAKLYKGVLRLDILRLRAKATDTKFKNSKFWGPAQRFNGTTIDDGYKMKWHNFGNGNVQFRLCVALVGEDAYLCHAYIKTSAARDRLMAGRLDDRILLIRNGKCDIRGELP